MLNTLKANVQVIFERDPAAHSWLEVLLCYPGLHALFCYQIAHWLYCLNVPLVPHLISHLSRFLTGIDIHPAAKIGKGVFIDHGMGVVIEETANVGDYTLIYQGVTIGGTIKEAGKRHPTLGKNVVVGAGAMILGNIQIGDQVHVGAGSVVSKDIPSNCTVVGIPGRIVRYKVDRVNLLKNDQLPDIESEIIYTLFNRIQVIEQKVERVRACFNMDFQAMELVMSKNNRCL